MRNFSRLFCGGVALAAMVMVIACGGGGEQQTSSEPVDPELLVSNPSAALGASAQRFEEEIDSVEAEFSFEFGMDGFAIGADGHFAYRAPDNMHMTMEMSGGDDEMFNLGDVGPIEMLLLGDDLYMNTGFTGWMTMSLDDLGADAESLREMMDMHAPLDFQALVGGLDAEVENLGPVEVGGNTYTRLRITTDLATVMDAMGEAVGEDSLGAGLFDVAGPMTMDILMNPETLLPFTFEANGDFGMGGESMEFRMAFKFFDYNGPVDIPAPPEDAVPFDEGFGDFFGE
jgi:hypothetical protein